MFQLTDTVKHLIIINVIIYFALNILNNDQLNYFFVMQGISGCDRYGGFNPAQLLTHMFNHGSTSHLFFNMFGVAVFGPILERIWGQKKFLIYYLVCGLGAAIAHQIYAVTLASGCSAALGASGALMGIVIGVAMKYPNAEVQLLFPPIPVKMKYLALFYVAYDLFFAASGANDGIAHYAHLGGALTGAILLLTWLKYDRRY